MRVGARRRRQTARPLPPEADDVRPRARAAAPRRRPRSGLAAFGRSRPAPAGRGRALPPPLLPRARRRHDRVLPPLPQRPAARAVDPAPARLRPLRRATVAHALLRAICGQLIEARRARDRAGDPPAIGDPAPRRESIAALSPAELRRLGLATHRASTLVRVCRSLDLEGLRGRPIEAVEARLLRERGLGPWALGVIALEGSGTSAMGSSATWVWSSSVPRLGPLGRDL